MSKLLNKVEDLNQFFPEVELDKGLEDYISTTHGFQFFKHPFYVGIYGKFLNHQINESVKKKAKLAAECYAKKDFSQYVFWHERPFRLDALMRVAFDTETLNEKQRNKMAKLIQEVWTDAEWPGVNFNTYLFLLRRFVRGSDLCLRAQRKVPLILYRGAVGNEITRRKIGISWTDDLEVATWFSMRNAQTFKKEPVLLRVRAEADDIFLMYNGRAEQEFLLDPRRIKPRVERI